METRTPGISKVITMVLFTLSCVGLLLFLWLSFGGNIPLNPQGYRIRVSFPNAGQLATQADVRIAGVSVGTVIQKSVDPNQPNRTIATIQMQNQYAPLHENATAILRQKTILGETYVELTEGSPNKPAIPDGGLLPPGQVAHAVQLDEIFNTFDPGTRQAFKVWQQELAQAITGNDQNLNNVLGNLPSFAASASDILNVLDIEHDAVVRLVQSGGTVFGALNQDPAALRSLITAGETTFATTAANQAKLAQTFQVFPTFLNQSRLTMTSLQNFSTNADPVIRELIPVAQDLGPTLQKLDQLSPDLHRLFVELGLAHPNLIGVGKTGLPATQRVLNGLKPLLGATAPFLEQLNPILSWLSLHQQLISDFLTNGAAGISATTTSFSGNGVGHYLRQFGPTGPETLSFQPSRDPNNRGNTYPNPLWAANPENFIKGDFPAWDCNNAGGQHPEETNNGTPEQSCWVAPILPGAKGLYQIPHITQAHYSSK